MPLHRVAPGVFRVESTLGSRFVSQWLLVGTDGAVLVDSGVAGTVDAEVRPALTELGLPPEALMEVVITHADVDHYGGDAELRELAPGTSIRAHALDRPLVESWERIAAGRYGWYRRRGLDYESGTWEWLRAAAGPDTVLDGTVAEGDRIDPGGLDLEVLELPGHSLGHVGVWVPTLGLAIVSDAVMGYGFCDREGRRAGPPPYVDVTAYRATIARLDELAPRLLGTAHFPVFEGEEVARFLDLSRRFTDDLERIVERASEQGTPELPDLLGLATAELGGYPEVEVELSRSIGAHLEST